MAFKLFLYKKNHFFKNNEEIINPLEFHANMIDKLNIELCWCTGIKSLSHFINQ